MSGHSEKKDGVSGPTTLGISVEVTWVALLMVTSLSFWVRGLRPGLLERGLGADRLAQGRFGRSG